MKWFSILFVLMISSIATAQLEKHMNEKLEPVCEKGSFLVGMAFENNIDFPFTLEDSERRNFNSIIAKKLSSFTHRKYNVILPKELDVYRKCAENEFVLLKLVSYKEIEVGGFERTGTIEIETLFFKTPDDPDPFYSTRVVATGKSDYGHSNPMENAIERASKELSKKLKNSEIQK